MSRYSIAEIDALKCKYPECKYIIYGKKDVCYKHYMLQFNKQNYAKNKEQIREQTKKWYFDHHSEQKEKKRVRQRNNPYYAQKAKEYWQEHKDSLGPKNKKRYEENSERYNKNYYINYKKPKYHSNPLYRLGECIGANLRGTLKAKTHKKNNRTSYYTGCSNEFLKDYLTKLFFPGMTWNNFGSEWHVDHIVPKVTFSLDDESQKKCWHYTNLRPLWAKDNLRKGTSLNYLSAAECEVLMQLF